jgi:hypothetical protein
MLHRSKIAIDVDSFTCIERRRQLSAAQMEPATRRTDRFPMVILLCGTRDAATTALGVCGDVAHAARPKKTT